MTEASDTKIRSELRALFSRYRVDQQRFRVRVTTGTVRLTGELLYHGSHSSQPMAGEAVENFTRDLGALRGVRHAFFDLYNWRRLSTGQWEPIALKIRAQATSAEPVVPAAA
jgi:hypothetical protein